MKYCMNYNQNTEHFDCINEVDEWTIKYNKDDNTLLDFLKQHEDKRINLYFRDNDVDINFLEDLGKRFKNLYFKLPLSYLETIKSKEEINFKYFFDEQVSSWDMFIGLVNIGISDIYIVEELAFELDKIAEIAHSRGISIRTFPNVAQSAWESTPGLKKFFIRPEDLEIYDEYIDTIEFYGDDRKSNIYYKVYAKDKKWFGLLNELIIDLNSDIDSKYIIPRFAEKRIRCGKSCIKGGHCRRCDRIEELSHSLEQSQLIVKIDNDNIDKK